MKKIVRILVSLGVMVLGVVLVVSGINKIRTKNLYDSTVTATVSEVVEELNDTDIDNPTTDTVVYIDYEVDGKKYEHVEAPEFSGNIKEGDKMEILYQSKDPSKISGKNITRTAVIFIAVGSVATLGGAVLTIRAIKIR